MFDGLLLGRYPDGKRSNVHCQNQGKARPCEPPIGAFKCGGQRFRPMSITSNHCGHLILALTCRDSCRETRLAGALVLSQEKVQTTYIRRLGLAFFLTVLSKFYLLHAHRINRAVSIADADSLGIQHIFFPEFHWLSVQPPVRLVVNCVGNGCPFRCRM